MSCEFVRLVRGGKRSFGGFNEVFAWRNAAASRSRAFMSAPCRSGRLILKFNVDEVRVIIPCAACFLYIFTRWLALVLILAFSSCSLKSLVMAAVYRAN